MEFFELVRRTRRFVKAVRAQASIKSVLVSKALDPETSTSMVVVRVYTRDGRSAELWIA